MDSKKCSQCSEVKLLTEYDKSSKTKLRSNCKPCRKKQNHDAYLRKKTKQQTI
jgi:hypothetical protein